ncbi:hypothetical protein D9M71_778840 [compost metagenome]
MNALNIACWRDRFLTSVRNVREASDTLPQTHALFHATGMISGALMLDAISAAEGDRLHALIDSANACRSLEDITKPAYTRRLHPAPTQEQTA